MSVYRVEVRCPECGELHVVTDGLQLARRAGLALVDAAWLAELRA